MSRVKIWAMFIVLAIAFVASARWFIVGVPGGAGVQLQNSTTLSITSAALFADQQDPNGVVLTVKLRLQ